MNEGFNIRVTWTKAHATLEEKAKMTPENRQARFFLTMVKKQTLYSKRQKQVEMMSQPKLELLKTVRKWQSQSLKKPLTNEKCCCGFQGRGHL